VAYSARWIERDFSAARCRAEAVRSIGRNRCSERDPDPKHRPIELRLFVRKVNKDNVCTRRLA